MVEKKVRVPLLLSKEELAIIERRKERWGFTTTSDSVRDSIVRGSKLEDICIDLLDALEAEGLLFYEDLAIPVQSMLTALDAEVDLEFPQLEKSVASGRPYAEARDAIRQARIEIEDEKNRNPPKSRIKLKKHVK